MHKKIDFGNEIIVLDCPDKEKDEHWEPGRNLANIPAPFRAILAACPNSGKSMVCKNIALYARPLYERIVVVSCSKDTKDYDELEPNIVLDRLPSIESFDRNYKNLLIIDDYKPKKSIDKALLDRFFGFVSSHCNTTILYCTQDLFALNSPVIRRMSNIFFLWAGSDDQQITMIGKRVGLGKNGDDILKQIFKELHFKKHDSLCIDLTNNTPAKLRMNIFQVIETKTIPDLP